jgi:hypothetical protein
LRPEFFCPGRIQPGARKLELKDLAVQTYSDEFTLRYKGKLKWQNQMKRINLLKWRAIAQVRLRGCTEKCIFDHVKVRITLSPCTSSAPKGYQGITR